MNKKQFKAHYVATFLASYMASRYDSDCLNGTHVYKQPVEDAEFLAEEAWGEYYNPYEIGRLLYKEGKGMSDIPAAVESDDDVEEALEGYMIARKVATGE